LLLCCWRWFTELTYSPARWPYF